MNKKIYTIVSGLSLLRSTAVLSTAVLVAVIQLSGDVLADQQPAEKLSEVVQQKSALTEPNLSEIIPLATDLSARLDDLESELTDILDLAPITKEFSAIAARIKEASAQLQTLQSSNKGTYVRYLGVKQELANEKLLLNKASKPVAAAIQQLDMWDHEWLVEHKNWQTWQSTLLKERSPDQLRVAFEKAELTINKARSKVLRQLEPLMAVQAMGAEVTTKLDLLNNQLGMLIAETLRDSLLGKSPPMYSSLYFSQFRIELWQGTWSSLSSFSWSDNSFFARYGFFYGLLSLLFIGASVVLRRNRQTLMQSKLWGFLAERPLSTPLFICALIAAVQLELSDGPTFIHLLNILVGGIACVRLVNHVLKQSWQKQAVYGVMTAYLVSLILLSSGVPTPIFRLYLFAVSLAGLIFCLRWQKESVKQGEPRLYSRVLGLNALLCTIIIIADFFGQSGVANYLFISSLMTFTILLPFMLLIYMIRGGVHWVFFSSPVWNIKLLRNDAAEYVSKSCFLIEASIVFFLVLPAILTAWGLFNSLPLAISGLLSPGFTMGGQYISVGLMAAVIVTLYGSFFASKLLPQVLLDEHISGRVMERGAQVSIGHLLKYVIIFIGFMLALSFVGIDLTKLTIILSAFGIGIGFGLQGIVNNFVSGLILLFERPLREGDTIEIGTNRAVIKKIGLRATNVQTFDNANVMIPNADLISNQVTNWTLSTREVRYSVPVGVAYGTDVNLVNETLLACAKDNSDVLKSPLPQALFLNLGDSSLDFELRVWIKDVDDRMLVRSALYYDIVKRFNEAQIVIPFPQRDLHLITGDESAVTSALHKPSGKNKLPE